MLPRCWAGWAGGGAGGVGEVEVGAGKRDAAGDPDAQHAPAPGNAAQAVFKNLAAAGIEPHVGPATVGDTLYSIAERFARIKHEMFGAPRLRHREFFF